MNQTIYLIGINHRTADVSLREQLALPCCNPCQEGLVRPDGPITEALILSTCNRVEYLVVGQSPKEMLDEVMAFWGSACSFDPTTIKQHIYTYEGMEAVKHLFMVASSLDSMILGEPQILGQLKQSYRKAVEYGSARVIVSRILHKAFSVAKRVRTETAIASHAVSISYAAVELAKRIFGDLAPQRAMLIGAGEMAELAATHLLHAGIQDMLVANRTLCHGEELARQFNGHAIPFEELIHHLPEVDIVISSTGSKHTIIQAREIAYVLEQRGHRPIFFIDIAVPRDIDPQVNNLDNVYLYDIDDLREVVGENLAERREEATKAQEIIAQEMDAFALWIKSLALKPTIVDLLQRGEAIAEKEIKKTLKSLGSKASPEVNKALHVLAHSLIGKLYCQPIAYLKRRSQEEGAITKSIHDTRRIFNLDNETIPEDAHKERKNQPCSDTMADKHPAHGA
ncbi:MAG: glutamyl-tRNA reductase [Deltaproteobacteria bacterium]|nr:MAG: glutamyl-tRNA reductase [Deltaproteobacteria bacterium]